MQIGGVTINLDTGPEHCLLDEDAHEFDRLNLERNRARYQGVNVLLALSVECEQLERLRAFQGGRTRYAALLVPAKEGDPWRFLDATRADAIAFYKSMLMRMQADHVTVEEIVRRVADRVEKMAVADGSIGKSEVIGIVAEDENALYGATLMGFEIMEGGSATTIPTVVLTAYSLVDQYLVTYNLHGDYEGEKTIEEMTAMMKMMMARLIKANT